LQETADQIDQRGFPRSIRTYEREHFPFPDDEINVIDSVRLAEGFAELPGDQQRAICWRRFKNLVHGCHVASTLVIFVVRRATVPTMPLGSANTRTMSTTPNNNCQYTVSPTAYVLR
jgi:hypothetical protein